MLHQAFQYYLTADFTNLVIFAEKAYFFCVARRLS